VKGQVTIPKPIRDHLVLRPGDRVEFEVDADGAVVVRKADPGTEVLEDRFAELMGCATAGLTTDEIMALTRGED
jgi:AbrB family looped-hinge helix DNA binding protein